MKRCLLLLFLLIFACAQVNRPNGHGGSGHDDYNSIYPVPAPGASFASDLSTFLKSERSGEMTEYGFPSFVVSGCLGATTAGLTHTPTSCIAYNANIRGTETGAITYPDNSTCWVAMDENTTGSNAGLPNFARIAGTHYLRDCVDVSQPTMAADSQLLMKVTTAGGAITAVQDLRSVSGAGLVNAGAQPVNIIGNRATGADQVKKVNINDAINPQTYGAKCDGVTDDNVALNAAFAASLSLVRPVRFPGTGLCATSVPLTYTILGKTTPMGLFGDGPNTGLQALPTLAGNVLNLTGNGGPGRTRTIFGNFAIKGAASGAGVVDLIKTSTLAGVKQFPLYLDGNNTAQNCFESSANQQFYSMGGYAHNCTNRGLWFSSSGGGGMLFEGWTIGPEGANEMSYCVMIGDGAGASGMGEGELNAIHAAGCDIAFDGADTQRVEINDFHAEANGGVPNQAMIFRGGSWTMVGGEVISAWPNPPIEIKTASTDNSFVGILMTATEAAAAPPTVLIDAGSFHNSFYRNTVNAALLSTWVTDNGSRNSYLDNCSVSGAGNCGTQTFDLLPGAKQAFEGATSGLISLIAQAVAGTWNWNWPITAGAAKQALLSQAGGSTAMTWGFPILNITTLAGAGTCDGTKEGQYWVENNSTAACSAGAIATSAGTTHCVIYCNATNWLQAGY